MSLFVPPPTETRYTFRRGTNHAGVWAIQRLLNAALAARLTADGVFGPATEQAVMEYQRRTNITVDGVVGPATQARMVRTVDARVDLALPDGVLKGLIVGESGGLIAAVNTAVEGGVDLGYVQERVYAPYSDSEVKRALDPLGSAHEAGERLLAAQNRFYDAPAVARRSDREEYAWRLAMLAHNWPYAAGELAAGRKLPEKEATWMPAGLRYPTDRELVPRTYMGWANFYALGAPAHDWGGLVTRYAFGLPG